LSSLRRLLLIGAGVAVGRWPAGQAWSQSGDTVGTLVFFGVGFGLALAGAAVAPPEPGCFFTSVIALLALELVGAVPVPAANGFAEPAPPPGFCSIPGLQACCPLLGVGEAVAAGTLAAALPGVFGAFGSCLGTLGNLCDRISAARIGAGLKDVDWRIV